jgi:N-acetylglucosamine-6-sulfatase
VSHKAVHSDFVPADRHRGRYDDEPLPVAIPSPAAMREGKLPMWVRNQRNSRHGADFGYNLADFDPAVYYRRYCESLLAVDDSVGRLVATLRERGQWEKTIFVYMGDNGFQFGDHGLIDKRTAYEASARVPLIVAAPGRVPAGQRSTAVVANIDIAGTLLDAAEAPQLPESDGRSFWSIAQGKGVPEDWRSALLYEYYWERNYPHTPTMHALIGSRYKYIRVHGLWDRDELYDLQSDPAEMHNLIDDPQHADRIRKLNVRLWEQLSKTGGQEMPLLEDRGKTFPWRHPERAPLAPFPAEYFRTSEPQ